MVPSKFSKESIIIHIKIDLLEEYGVHTTFNFMDLTPFAGSEDEEVEACDLRTNPFKREGMMEKAQAQALVQTQQLGP